MFNEKSVSCFVPDRLNVGAVQQFFTFTFTSLAQAKPQLNTVKYVHSNQAAVISSYSSIEYEKWIIGASCEE